MVDFTNVVKGEDFAMEGDYPGISRWSLHSITSVLLKGRYWETELQEAEDNVTTKAK